MINVGIVGCGFVGGALKAWLEKNNPNVGILVKTESISSVKIVFRLSEFYINGIRSFLNAKDSDIKD